MLKKLFKWIQWSCIAITASLFLILFSPVTEYLHKPLLINDPPEQSDAIILLSWFAFDSPDGGMPDFSSLTRINKAVELYKKGFSPRIICVGANRLENNNISYGMLLREFLLRYGVPRDAITVYDRYPGDWNYYDNIVSMVAEYKKTVDFNKIMVVTSSQNTFRIYRCFQKLGYTPRMISSSLLQFHPYNWHTRFEFFRDVANEYYAIMLFLLFGRI